jgi:hypothetical protein
VLSAIFLLGILLAEVKALRDLELVGIRIQTYQNVALGLFGSAAVGRAMSMATYFYEKVKSLKARRFALNDTCRNPAEIRNDLSGRTERFRRRSQPRVVHRRRAE